MAERLVAGNEHGPCFERMGGDEHVKGLESASSPSHFGSERTVLLGRRCHPGQDGNFREELFCGFQESDCRRVLGQALADFAIDDARNARPLATRRPQAVQDRLRTPRKQGADGVRIEHIGAGVHSSGSSRT